MTHWSPQQDSALQAVSAWLKLPKHSRPQVFRLFGYAGTGKTTLAKELAAGVKGEVIFGAFTGKAAHVLHKKGCKGAATIHSLIYRVDDSAMTYEPRFILNRESPVADAGLIIIDEVSMVGEDLGRDLLSFGTPVLVLGDPAQLPPVRGEGFFTNCDPDFMLTEVHRQAKDSPIIALATTIREGGRLSLGNYGESRVIDRSDLDSGAVLEADQVLVGLNKTRIAYNRRIRELNGIADSAPRVGEKLICLKNDRNKKLLNGSLWTAAEVKNRTKKDRAANVIRIAVRGEDWAPGSKTIDVKVREEFFNGDEASIGWEDMKGTDQFTFGYALTCHKSQGSQWPNVMVFDEAGAFREDANRWRYTALTRAAEQVTVVLP